MTEPAVPGIRRHYVTLGARQIHYRRSGPESASVVLALHRPPRASRDLTPLLAEWGRRLSVIAPDLAGYGTSSPLPMARPLIEDYAADLEQFLAALGIDTALVYAERETAWVACALAARFPGRVRALVMNGTPIWTAEERVAGKAAYAPYAPSWDGGHLAWMWSYLREENAFHPWWVKRADTRLAEDMPSSRELGLRSVQFLTAGRHGRGYEAALLAALDYDGRGALGQLRVPTLLLAARSRREDVFLERLVEAPSSALREVQGNYPDTLERAQSFLLQHAAALPPAPAPPRVRPIAGELARDYVPVSGGQLHFHGNIDASTLPLLVQHDAASSIGTVEPVTRSFIGRRAVLAFDMPGSGESDDILGDGDLTVEAYATTLREALDALGIARCDFYGMWGGGFVGLDLAFARPAGVRRLLMSNLFQHEGERQRQILAFYTPGVSPLWHGGHLQQCWHQMRDQGIYYPWFDRSAAGVIPREPFLDVGMVHERVCSLLKAGNRYRTAYHAHQIYPTFERLRSTPVPTTIATADWDPNYASTLAAARAAPNCTLRILDPDFRRWGLSLLEDLTSADAEEAGTNPGTECFPSSGTIAST